MQKKNESRAIKMVVCIAFINIFAMLCVYLIYCIPVYRITTEITFDQVVDFPEYEDIVIGTKFCKPYRGIMKNKILNTNDAKIKQSIELSTFINNKEKGVVCAHNWIRVIKDEHQKLKLNSRGDYGNEAYSEKTIIAILEKKNAVRYIALAAAIIIYMSFVIQLRCQENFK